MTVPETIAEIESNKFSALANFASDRRTFFRLLRESDGFKRLRLFVASRENAALVVRRVQELAARAIDYRVENPWDVALAAYLMALHSEQLPAARVAAAAAAGISNVWWLRKVLTLVQAPEIELTTSTSTVVADTAFVMPRAEPADIDDLVIHAVPGHVERLLDEPRPLVGFGAGNDPVMRIVHGTTPLIEAHSADSDDRTLAVA